MVPGTRPAATADDERDGGELESDEDEMAALEGQRLVAKFRCGILLDALGVMDNLPS